MELKNRKAILKKADGSLSTKIEIAIDDAIPISTLSTKILDVQTINSVSVTNTAPTNILEDDGTLSSRFTFLVRGFKNYNDMSVNVFYDSKYKDFILITDIDYYDLNIKRFDIKLRGKRLGSVGDLNRNVSSTGELKNLILPNKVADLTSVDVITLNLHGFYNTEDGKINIPLSNGNTLRKDLNPVTFIRVDKNTLFGAGVELPVYTVEPGSGSKFVNNYVGDQNTDYVYFLIPN